MKKKVVKILILIILAILLIFNFNDNFIVGKDWEKEMLPRFDIFQSDSEYLVFSKMFQDKYGRKENQYGLCTVRVNGERVEDITALIRECKEQESIEIHSYQSQFGLQGYIFSFMYNKMHLPFSVIKLIGCTLLACIIVAICYIIYQKYGKLLGEIFYLTFLLSPWVVAMARNLYWVEFTFFLPMLLGLILSINDKRKKVLIPSIFLAILIRCLCGYEYITTIMLGTIVFFIVDFFTIQNKEKRKDIFKTTIIVGVTCLSAFIIALCIHGGLRGDGNIVEGIKTIYKEDILRRTILNSEEIEFPEAYKESLQATVGETISKYFSWTSNIILGIEGKYFTLMVLIATAIVIYNVIKKKKNSGRDMILFIMFFITTISWFVLGKAHSYIHLHINYVLWYFGFVQMCLYEIVQFICQKAYEIGKELEEG